MRPGNPEALQQPYDPGRIESRWYAYWEERGVFQPRADAAKERFVIAIPPPNVTGSLTMGHLLGDSIRDVIVRWQRMEGKETLYIPGTDHAGIATQNVVEKKLAADGVTRQQVGRENFVGEVWAWREQYGGLILRQLRRLGASPDWTRERFTLDAGYSHAVLHVLSRSTTKVSFTAAAISSTGARAAGPRSRTKRSRTSRPTATCGTSATPSRGPRSR